MPLTKLIGLLLVVSFGPACASLTQPETLSVGGSTSYASSYWFRGAPVNARPVIQGDFGASVNTDDNGSLSLSTWYNFDGSNSTGSAFSPNGNGGEITEVDYVLDYSRNFGSVGASLGLISYNFPNGVGNSTTEAYLGLSSQWLGFSQAATLYYDFDNVNGSYLSLQGSKSFQLAERTSLNLSVLLGYMDENQSNFYFGNSIVGLSDISATANLSYTLDENSSLFVSVTGVRPLENEFEDALQAAGVEDSAVIGSIGISWSF